MCTGLTFCLTYDRDSPNGESHIFAQFVIRHGQVLASLEATGNPSHPPVFSALVRGWQVIRLAVGLALGISQRPRPCLWGFLMRTLHRSGFRHSSRNCRRNHLEPPYTDPYVRWCGRRRRVTAAPMPVISYYRSAKFLRPDLKSRSGISQRSNHARIIGGG